MQVTQLRLQGLRPRKSRLRQKMVGIPNMVDPMSGKVFNVATGYNAYWTGDGYIYGTYRTDRSPKFGLHKLQDL